MAEVERLTLRYMPRFKCIAGDCKENCCSGLHVRLTEENHRKLLERSAAFPELKAKVAEVVRLEPEPTRTPEHFSLVASKDSRCQFLDPDRLCSIQRHLSEETLPDPCSTFPRILTQVGERLELSGTFACPEVARLCLTGEDAVDLVPYEPGIMAREILVRRYDAAATDPYLLLLDHVRQVCLEVMAAPALRPQVRLLLLLDFAQRIEPFFHAGTTTFEAGALLREVEATPSRVGAVERIFERVPEGDGRAVRALKEILVARLPSCDNPRFNTLVRPMVLAQVDAPVDVISRYFEGAVEVACEDALLHGRYLERRRACSPAQLALRDEQFRRYVLNSLIKDWYSQRPTLASALRRLVLRAALSQFAALMHPLAGGLTPQTPLALLEEAAVEAFQIVSKNVEHVPTFMDLCERYLQEKQLGSVAGLALLLRL